jgi:hypothetical protein
MTPRSIIAGLALCFGALGAQAQGVVNAICSTDQSWCELAAQEFSRATGIRVLQTRKPTGEAFAQIRAEAANPKTDLWWGGTGDPFYQAAEAGLLDPYRPDYLDQFARLGGAAVRHEPEPRGRLLHQRHRLRLERRRAEEKEPAAAQVLEGPAGRPLQGRDRDPRIPVPAAPATPSWPAWCR